jgi:hypothetical protein
VRGRRAVPGLRYSMRERLGALVPGLTLGLAAGVVGGMVAAGALDTTDYDRADLNTASREARLVGSAQGSERAARTAAEEAAKLRAANAEQVGRLEDRLAKSVRAVKSLRAEASDRQAKLNELRGSLQETETALENATAATSDTADQQTVQGTLRATWQLGNGAKPWPQSCAPALESYGVRVTAGQDATVATARLVNVEVTRRAERKNTLRLTCSMTYTASLPTPLGSAYRFVVSDADGAALQSKQAAAGPLAKGTGPTLAVTR